MFQYIMMWISFITFIRQILLYMKCVFYFVSFIVGLRWKIIKK